MVDRCKIVVVDDEPRFVQSLKALFHSQYEIHSTQDGRQATALVRTTRPELILLNLCMPEVDGYHVLRQLKQQQELSDIPIIVVTGLHETADETKSLRMGAVDYVTKPYNPDILSARIDRQLAIKRQQDFFKVLSYQDYLTNIPNRRFFNELLEREHKRCRRNQTDLSLLMIDVDYFKRYNDIYGHLDGDKCLIRVVEAMTRQLRRPSDQLSRFGGEEFACILPETNLAGARKLAVSLQQSIYNLGIVHTEGVNNRVTISIGIACSQAHEETSANRLLSLADRSLYQAKAQGRNSICSA